MGATHFLASDFDFALPPELIAQQPAPERDQARLLLLTENACSHHVFSELPELLLRTVGAGALLVLNDTQVLPARLRARKLRSPGDAARADAPLGGQVELLLCEPIAEPRPQVDPPQADPAEARAALPPPASGKPRWRCMYRASKPLRAGAWLQLRASVDVQGQGQGQAWPDAVAAGLAQVLLNEGGGYVIVEFAVDSAEALLALLTRIGEVPLPPYIHREQPGAAPPGRSEADRERYQTVFAKVPGSVAAPTAGLHFTPQVLAALRGGGLDVATVTLHVGPGTFMPMRTGDPREHVMHQERYHVPAATAAAIAQAKAAGRPVVAVGTTVVRTLESATPPGAHAPRPGLGTTELFIYPRGPGQPQHRFQVVDALLTNFHLPRSTLLMLVAAFAGRRRVLAAYAEAVAQRYRFFSFGDAMLIPRRLADPECLPLADSLPEPSGALALNLEAPR